MKHSILFGVVSGRMASIGLGGALLLGCNASPASRLLPLDYPLAARGDHVDVYHGVQVADPYRWLEDSESEPVRAWITAQNQLATTFLAADPGRDALRRRLEELLDYERISLPILCGGRLFYEYNDGLRDQSVLLVQEGPGEAPSELLDPATLAADGTVSLAAFVPSPDGKLLAWASSDGGSDWRTWRFLEVATRTPLDDTITRNKFGGLDWNDSGTGVYYLRYPRPSEGERLRELNPSGEVAYHALGTDEDVDRLIAAAPADEGIMLGFSLTEDRQRMVLSRFDVRTRENDLDLLHLAPPNVGLRRTLVADLGARTSYVGDSGNEIFLRTDYEAPNGRVVAVDSQAPARAWRELVPAGEHALQSVTFVGGKLFVRSLVDATAEVRVFSTSGRPLGDVSLPGLGSVSGFRGTSRDPVTYFSFTNHTRPRTIYSYDCASGTKAVFRSPPLRFDPTDFIVEQVFVESKDGTRVPMFLAAAKGLERDGRNPTWLYGYGGFGISLTPSFSVANLVWMERGGLVAIPNLRGGGEYGEPWHEAGTKLAKQNVFDDFIAAAEWLIANGYTSPERLAIGGDSNGGLLVGATMLQRPELFAAAVPSRGVLDMLRYHEFTIGWGWAGDYGTSAHPDEFRALLAYSPVHNVHAGEHYPATLVLTADRDDRVVPAHSYKFAAALQAAQGHEAPVLLRVQTRAGHGAGTPTRLRIEQDVDRLSFLFLTLAAP